ncbi:MAG: hypothetical protein ACOCWQ_02540 [Nanoarchaeota archaeon]
MTLQSKLRAAGIGLAFTATAVSAGLGLYHLFSTGRTVDDPKIEVPEPAPPKNKSQYYNLPLEDIIAERVQLSLLSLEEREDVKFVPFEDLPSKITPIQDTQLEHTYERFGIHALEPEAHDPHALREYLANHMKNHGMSLDDALSATPDDIPQLMMTIHQILRNNIKYFDKVHPVADTDDFKEIVSATNMNHRLDLDRASIDRLILEGLQEKVGDNAVTAYTRAQELDSMHPQDILGEGIGYCRHSVAA